MKLSISNLSLKSLYLIEVLAVCLILIANIFYTSTIAGNEHSVIHYAHPAISVLALVSVGILAFLASTGSKKLKLKYFIVLIISLDLLALLFWLYNSKLAPFADQLNVYTAALRFNLHDYRDFVKGGYVYEYNQQAGLVVMFSLILHLFKDYRILEALNVLGVLGLHLGLFRLTKEVFNESAAKLALILSSLFVPIILLTSYVYGDIPGLCLAVWSMCFTIKYSKEDNVKYIVFASLLLGLAMLFRTNMQIILIATILYLLLQRRARRIVAVLIIITSLSFNYAVTAYASARTGSALNQGVPASLFVNMGLEESSLGDGWYNGSTLRNYYAVKLDHRAASHLGFELISKRLADMGDNPGYALNFFKSKFLSTWTEPTFESIFFTLPHNQTASVVQYMQNNRLLHSLYHGQLNKIYLVYCKGFVLFLLIGAAAYPFRRDKKTLEDVVFIFLPLLGGMAFHLFWETKSRYIYPYVIMLLPIAAGFWHNIKVTEVRSDK
ncbi:MAG TPA: glycosyltransferase family 39 protein [Desulfobacteria bacterium]|nr:glycosyltransferase family 39 protein [Desulfobacteria bacterium]